MVVAQPVKPVVNGLPALPTVAALQMGAAELSSLTTMEVGTAGVRVLLIKSLRAESETSAFGVTVQEQQETSCSSGEKTYMFAQMLLLVIAAALLTASPTTTGTLAPVLVRLT